MVLLLSLGDTALLSLWLSVGRRERRRVEGVAKEKAWAVAIT